MSSTIFEVKTLWFEIPCRLIPQLFVLLLIIPIHSFPKVILRLLSLSNIRTSIFYISFFLWLSSNLLYWSLQHALSNVGIWFLSMSFVPCLWFPLQQTFLMIFKSLKETSSWCYFFVIPRSSYLKSTNLETIHGEKNTSSSGYPIQNL